MRHNVAGKKLGRKTEHRLSMFRNLLKALVKNERIETTLEKAKNLRHFADRVITWGKKGDLHSKRMVYRYVPNHKLVKKVFDELAPRFMDRAGGYTRVLKLGKRDGDGAERAIIEYVDFVFKPKKQKKEKTAKGK
ncbi:MAG: 50S ribosomal protein L17 [Thermoanaerobaculia bacterium]